MRTPNYIRIFHRLQDGQWHKKSDFCRPYSEDRRRLNEMEQRGWINYEERTIWGNGAVLYSEYRITKIWDIFWDYHRKHSLTRVNPQGQMEMVV